jgi:hypothetical protein
MKRIIKPVAIVKKKIALNAMSNASFANGKVGSFAFMYLFCLFP